MSRRPAVLFLAATGIAAGTLTAGAETAAPELPRPSCPRRLVDAVGDAVHAGGSPVKIDGLDITGVHLRLTADQFQVFMAVKDVKKPEEMPLTDGGYQYVFTAKHNEKTVTFKTFQKNSQQPWATVQNPPTAATRGDTGTDTSQGTLLAGWTQSIDADKNYVIFTAPRAKMEEIYGFPLVDGAKFESIVASGVHYAHLRQTAADTLDITGAAASWTIGDEYCFGAPPAVLSDVTAPAVAYTDSVTLSAKLVGDGAAAAPVQGRTVEFRVAGEPAALTGTTGADGIASVTYTPTVGAGTHPVTVRFGGDTEHGKATATGTVTVTTEATTFGPLKVAKPTATTRTVTATLLDNDAKLLGGQKVDWYVNGKKVATIVTDASGRSVFKSAKPTQTVQAKFVGVAGKFAASATKPLKV